MNGSQFPRDTESGFVLPMVLWTIVAMTLVAAVIAQWVSNGVDHARLRQLDTEAEIEIFNAQSTALYVLTTQYFSVRGLEINNISIKARGPADPLAELPKAPRYISLDDQPYTLGQVLISFQDTRGLINLNLAQDDEIFRLLGVFGVPVQARNPLVAKLRDYSDPNNLIRLNGAKAPQYEAAGKPPPSQAPLITPWEAKRVLDWDKFPSLWGDRDNLAAASTTSRTIGLNLNTAPAPVLSLVEGMNQSAVDRIMKRRRSSPIVATNDFEQLGSIVVPSDPLRYVFFPSETIRLRFATKTRSLERVVVIQLTPQQISSPWRIDYTVDVPPLSAHASDLDQPLDFPTPALASVEK